MEGASKAPSGTSPASLATLIAQSYALCHGSSAILLLEENRDRGEERQAE